MFVCWFQCAGVGDAEKYIGQMFELLAQVSSTVHFGVVPPQADHAPAGIPHSLTFTL